MNDSGRVQKNILPLYFWARGLLRCGRVVKKVRKYFRLISPAAPGTGPDYVAVHSHLMPVIYRRHERARNYVLRLHSNKTVVVTVPRGGSQKFARDFVASRKGWLEKQWRLLESQQPAPQPLRPGMQILFRGRLETLLVPPNSPPGELLLGDQRLDLEPADHDLRPYLEKRLRALAVAELTLRVGELAREHRCEVRRVAVRNQKTRWGSCSRAGAISLNWRLIQLPAHVRDYIIIHELMHLRRLNHSPQFWAEVERACPSYRLAEDWLKRHSNQIAF